MDNALHHLERKMYHGQGIHRHRSCTSEQATLRSKDDGTKTPAFIKSLNISFSKVATRNALRDRKSKKNSTGI